MATRRRLLGALIFGGLVALALPAPARRPAAPPAAPVVYPRYAQATTPLDHWQRRTAPVLVADQPWEHGMVCEPTVLLVGGRYQMWYFGGNTRAAIGYAASADGLHWHKHRGPVVGLGTGGWPHMAMRNFVLYRGGTYYLYFASDDSDRALHLATSRDGVHFKTQRRPVLAPDAQDTGLANTDVWVEGTRWYMLYEAWNAKLALWRMGLAEGSGPSDWRRVADPLPTLAIGPGMYGGAAVLKRAATYHLWYHAARTTTLPTDIYHAQSRDLIHWTRVAGGPVLPRALPWEVDQTADASILRAGPRGRLLLYYAGMDNSAGRGAIGLAQEPQAPRSRARRARSTSRRTA